MHDSMGFDLEKKNNIKKILKNDYPVDVFVQPVR